MSDFIKEWFQWFEEGISNNKDNDTFFGVCGKRCANTGVIHVYEELYKQSDYDLNIFFERLNEINGLGGKIIKPDKEYEILFKGCLCDLYTNGYIKTDVICECSRHSLNHIFKKLLVDKNIKIMKIETILGGAALCCFKIIIDEEK